jgi:hypothetical protein
VVAFTALLLFLATYHRRDRPTRPALCRHAYGNGVNADLNAARDAAWGKNPAGVGTFETSGGLLNQPGKRSSTFSIGSQGAALRQRQLAFQLFISMNRCWTAKQSAPEWPLYASRSSIGGSLNAQPPRELPEAERIGGRRPFKLFPP